MAVNRQSTFTFYQALRWLQRVSAKITLAPRLFVAVVFLLLSSQLVYAATNQSAPPDAGQILQQIERDLEVKPTPKLPELPSQPPAIEDTQAEMVLIKQFKFTGNHVLVESELQAALAKLTNRSVSITELRTCTDLIAALYHEKGYLATATLPEQDITEGVVTIDVVEALFGGVKFDGSYNKDFKRVKPQVMEQYILNSSPKGVVLNQEKLDRGLQLIDGLTGVKVESTLQAGEQEGTTDLLMKVKDQPLLNGNVAVDNTGGRQTGRNKLTATLNVASPLGYGDALSFTALHADGTDYGRVSYSLPLGAKGLLIGVSGTYMQYNILQQFSSLNLNGYSSTFGVNAQYPLFKDKTSKLNLSVNADKKYFTNFSTPTTVQLASSDYSLNVYSATLSGDHMDGLFAGAQNNASISLGGGNVDLNGSLNQASDLAGANTAGSFSRLHWNLSRNQFFTDTISLSLSGSGQFANGNLDSSEKFYLGGLNGVRAYPTSEGSGSDGYLFVAELRKYLPHNLSVSTFIDYGHVTQYDHNQSAAGKALATTNSYDLKGYGASMDWQGPYNTNVKATYAHRIGSNPNPAASGNDQDGSKLYNVFWLSAVLNL